MFSFLKPKPKVHPVAVFALETDSVTLTIVNVSEEKGGEVILVVRHSLGAVEGDSAADMIRKATTKMEQIFKDLFDTKRAHLISHASSLTLFGASWNISWKDKIVVKKDKPFHITKSLITDSVRDAFVSAHAGFSIISSHVMNVSLNGYKIKDPVGKIAPEVDFEVFIEAAPDEVLSALDAVVGKHLPHNKNRFSTLSYAAIDAVTQSTELNSFVLILPEHLITEITIVKDGSVHSSMSLPVGTLGLARQIFGKEISEHEAVSRARRFITSDLDLDMQSLSGTVNPFFETRKRFLESFRNALWDMNKSELCPNIIFIAGKSPAARFMSEWIRSEDYSGQIYTIESFKVSELSGEDLLKGITAPFVSAVSKFAAESLIKASRS